MGAFHPMIRPALTAVALFAAIYAAMLALGWMQ